MNLRPLGPQPSALPSYAIPREQKLLYQKPAKKQPENIVRNIQKRKRTRRFRRSFQFFTKTESIRHVQWSYGTHASSFSTPFTARITNIVATISAMAIGRAIHADCTKPAIM